MNTFWILMRLWPERSQRVPACAVLGCLLLLAAGAPSPRAAVVHDSQSVSFGNATLLVFPHTVGIGVDRVLVVGVSIYSGNKTVSSITYGGVALAPLGYLDGGSGANDRRMEMWILADPAIGTADVVVTMSGGSKLVAGAASFFGVDALAPTGGFVSNEGNSNFASLAVPSAPGELVMDVLSVTGNATTAVVGPGQSPLWNEYSRPNDGAVAGAASTEPGAAGVTMSWNLAANEYWVIGAVSLKPAPPRPYLVDAMIKPQIEPVAAYAYDGWYENPAALQEKAASVLAGVPAAYTVRFDNDGQNVDGLTITGTASSAAFVVEYRDAANVDRTAAVTSSGYTLPALGPGASTAWTLLVAPVLGAASGGDAHPVTITATSSGDPLVVDQVRAVTTCVSPNLSMQKLADLTDVLPGQDINYTIVASTVAGLSDATAIVVVDSIPDYAGFRVGSATFTAGTTTLTSTVSYSNDDGFTWSYVPGTGSCAAPSGYDYCVTHVRWTLAGTMPPSLSFQLGMAIRVK